MGSGGYSDTQAPPKLDSKLWEGPGKTGNISVKEKSKEQSIEMN